MIYPNDFEIKLNFDQIREHLKSYCLCPLGIAFVAKMRYTSDFDLLDKLLHQTKEFKQILDRQLLFPSQNYLDPTTHLQQLKIIGICLEPSVFFDLKVSLNTIRKCLTFFEDTEEFPYLKKLAEQVNLDPKILRKINEIIDDHGQLKDDASEELRLIRKNILEEESNIRKELDRILKALIRDKFSPEDSAITIRNGRMVVPVIAESKRKVKGFIHGESGTGQTVFIEPTQILEINNEIQDLKNREKREIIRILTELTAFMSFYQEDLIKAYQFLGLIDFIRSKAKLAIHLDGNLPLIKKETTINLQNARHPLLQLSLAKANKKIIPLNLKLNPQKRILLISGPNAGGKSICLKTLGILQYMLQCGLLPSCDEHSTMCLFNDIFLDIGDEQSIENDLSTYSSHLKNMKSFLQFASKNSLILIDEFGGGTEPQFGAAIAESILEKINEKKVFGVITTHFANLKSFADTTEGLLNGAMSFNIELLEPLFELKIGTPGSSFALELAKKIGLPEEIIHKSKEKLGTKPIVLEELIKKLENEKTKFYNKNQNTIHLERKFQEKLNQYDKLVTELETNKNKYLQEAKAKAKLLLIDVNKKIEQTIREIKESGAEKSKTKILRDEIKSLEKYLDAPINIPQKSETILNIDEEEFNPNEPLKIGDWVKLKDNGTIGKLLNIKNKDAEIAIGDLNSKVRIERLVKAQRKEYREQLIDENKNQNKTKINLNEKLANFSPHVDYRGMRGEDVLVQLIQLMDNALLFGINQLRIVHGKGDGILRRLIREKISNYNNVKTMYDEHADRGGAGVTIVEFK
ncbi:MAG: endonuclease MutS2 [Cytophagales bacterium]|nr:MAG: endonuclease MutS2 [Cytophagales bacterium]